MPDSENVNYRFFVHLITSLPNAKQLKALDYGCGQGTTVRLLRDAGIECYGAEACYGGASHDLLLESDLYKSGIIRVIPESGELPFPDKYFDVIISNQVFEHVSDKQSVLLSLNRVLKDDGFMHHHFPSREVIKEGHIGIPMAHWFASGRLRLAYTVLARCIGFGQFKEGQSIKAWSRRQLDWIDNYCHYEPYRDLYKIMSAQFDVSHHEIDYCRFRAEGQGFLSTLMAARMLSGIYERLFRSLGFMVIELRKHKQGC